MLVKKAAAHIDDFAPAHKDNVRLAGKSLMVKPVSETHTVDQRTHHEFWFGIAVTDLAHVCAAGFRRQFVHAN